MSRDETGKLVHRVTCCTRTSPLPLLPSGPGGVGGIASRRTRHTRNFNTANDRAISCEARPLEQVSIEPGVISDRYPLNAARSLAPRANHHQTNPTHQRHRAQNRRNRHRPRLLVLDLHRAHIHILLFVRETHAARDEPNNPHNDEKNSHNSCCFQCFLQIAAVTTGTGPAASR
jgi:hypothetical protein